MGENNDPRSTAGVGNRKEFEGAQKRRPYTKRSKHTRRVSKEKKRKKTHAVSCKSPSPPRDTRTEIENRHRAKQNRIVAVALRAREVWYSILLLKVSRFVMLLLYCDDMWRLTRPEGRRAAGCGCCPAAVVAVAAALPIPGPHPPVADGASPGSPGHLHHSGLKRSSYH